jgi:NAD(P)-dependent dehydrogenase (short-subunit alcohol dehydrogenase family)
MALIVGAGSGLSASLARLFAREGMQVALAARSVDKLASLCAQTGARAYACDAADAAQVDGLFEAVSRDTGEPTVVVFNAGARRGDRALDPARVKDALAVGAFGGFLVAQRAARRMCAQGRGAILFTGASASVKGYAQSAPFAMGKFALRLARPWHGSSHPRASTSRVVIDSGIASSYAKTEPTPGTAFSIPMPSPRPTCTCRRHRSAWAEVECAPGLKF